MKKILIVLILLVAVAAAAPFFLGSQIEKAARQQVEVANQQLAKMIQSNPQIKDASITIESYDKQYMNSTANSLVKFSVNLPTEPEAKRFEIPVKTVVTHGPYLGDAGFGAAKLVSKPDLSNLELPDAINADTFVIENVVGFSGNTQQLATIAPIKYEAEGSVIDFAGASISTQGHIKNQATFTGEVKVQQLVLSNEEDPNLFTLKPFSMDIKSDGDAEFTKGNYTVSSGVIEAAADGDKVAMALQSMQVTGSYAQAKGADFMLGNASGVFKDLTITNSDLSPEPVKVPELAVSSEMTQAEGTDLDVLVKYQLTLDPSVNKVMQSPVDVQTATLEVSLKALPVAAIQKYQSLMQDLSTTSDAVQSAETMQSELMSVFTQLIGNASAAHLELHAKAAEGDLNADIDLGFKPGLALSEQELMQLLAEADFAPYKILAILVGRGQLDLDKSVTDKAGLTPMLQIMAADFVTLEGESFKSEFLIRDEQLLVNGKPVPMMMAPEAEMAPEADSAMDSDEAAATDSMQMQN